MMNIFRLSIMAVLVALVISQNTTDIYAKADVEPIVTETNSVVKDTNNDLATHDSDVDAAIANHDIGIKEKILQQSTDIMDEIATHDIGIKDAISQHDTDIMSDIATHDSNMTSEHSGLDTKLYKYPQDQ